jgi:hypothetical protein
MVIVAEDDARLVRLENKVDSIQTNMVRRDDFVRLTDTVQAQSTEMIPRKEYEARHIVLQQGLELARKDLDAEISGAAATLEKRIVELSGPANDIHKDHEERIRTVERQRLPQWATAILWPAIASALSGGITYFTIRPPHP